MSKYTCTHRQNAVSSWLPMAVAYLFSLSYIVFHQFCCEPLGQVNCSHWPYRWYARVFSSLCQPCLWCSSKAAPPAHHPCLLSSWWCGCSYLETSFPFKFFNAWLLPTKKIGNCAHSFFNGTHFTVTHLASFPCLSMFTCNISLPYFSIIFGKMF